MNFSNSLWLKNESNQKFKECLVDSDYIAAKDGYKGYYIIKRS